MRTPKGAEMATLEAAEVGQRVRALRLAKGWSLRQLAERSGVTHGWIEHLESGRRSSLDVDRLGRLAGALGVTLEELIGEGERAPGKRKDGLAEMAGLTDEELAEYVAERTPDWPKERIAQMIAEYRTLPEEEQAMLLWRAMVLRMLEGGGKRDSAAGEAGS